MSDFGAWVLLLGRLLFVVYFANAAVFHISKGEMAAGYAKQMGFPAPALGAWPSGVWLAAGAVSVLFGIWADLGALLIAGFPIPAALWIHPFWKIEDPNQKQTEMMNFLRNVTYVGAGLALFAFFATFGHGLALTITDPLFDLRP
jgi:putative oxidoreductase